MIVEDEWKQIQKVLIGKGVTSAYLWNFFNKAFVSDEIGIQYHNKYMGTAKTLIDGLRNFGWVPKEDCWVVKITTKDRETNKEYEIEVNRIVLEKLGAIRGI